MDNKQPTEITTLQVLQLILANSDHKAECPFVGDLEAADCPCGHAEARRKVASHIERIEREIHGMSGF